MVRFSNSNMSKLFFKIKLIIDLFKISNLIMLSGRLKITICNNAYIWNNKVIRCVKSRFEDDSNKDILYKQRTRF